ncbi:DEAD/DEAH box helicase family protein [uncultured Methanobrevibacter sp.]|uniref:DEAD/DEAH box helicase family protein n=1 Tax=uncultured Methanobrevibacter sp. TaxID=253161 RepID=UPI0025FCDA75|nr:DEAD/DEAH box helicase family protein [uncultured Methanobrevibacter sp.]
MLNDLNIKFKYDSDKDDLINEFYMPVLSNSSEYYRMSGFFSSTSLAISAQGISNFIINDGKMKLICSAVLSKEDKRIIEESNENPTKFIEKYALNDFRSMNEGFVKEHVEALGWMLANDLLEIKIAIPKNNQGIFHSKIGVLKDDEDNIISFSGSDNETASGWLHNIEEFKVFCSWDESEKKFVYSDLDDFNRYWRGDTVKTDVVDIPLAIKNELIKLAPKSKNDLTIFKSKKSKIKLRDYQNEAIKNWFNNDCCGLLEMATGTGKTFTALSCFKELADSKDKLVTVIACPQSHLIDQWVKDVKIFHDGKIIIASGKNSNWKDDLKNLRKKFLYGALDKAVVMTTHASLSSDYFIKTIKKFDVERLLIVDEVHGIGSFKQRLGLNECYEYRLGLSATPKRWFDEEGTTIIEDFFKGTVYEFDISRALTEINPDTNETYLAPYYYYPIIVDLNDEEYDEYISYSYKIAQILSSKKIKNKDKELTKYNTLRQRIINNAENKYFEFDRLLKENPGIDKLIVFCSPQQIDYVQQILNENRVIPQHKFTEKESATISKITGMSERDEILQLFAEGSYKALVAIKCLDEGVDVPVAETAIIMSSTSNPREHVQRRGRILRRAPGKKYAVIYDILVFPEEQTDAGSKIMKKEILRYKEFAENAINSYDCLKLLRKYYDMVVE